MSNPKLEAISTVRGYIKSINFEIDEIRQSKKTFANIYRTTLPENESINAINELNVSTIKSIELLTKELAEKQTFLSKIKNL